MSPNFSFGRQHDFYELLADGIVHGIGIVLAVIGISVLVVFAKTQGDMAELTAAWVYGIGLVGALSISLFYNMLPHSHLKWIMRRFDHSAIFVLIAATYTPFLQQGADDPRLHTMLIVVWIAALAGICLKCVFPGRYDRAAIGLYLLLGWAAALQFGSLSDHLPPLSMMLIVVGGVIYSAGVIFHVWKRLRFQTAIWHSFVVLGAAVHYSAVVTAFHAGAL
ncbi:PAQR family membrane homeostasis protein TrhA [Paracoccus sp. (in: a-proteobacteria)]|uniref:PAQR family membrane homeostasis protein TrhA n=1 Tax=Paracoccus sp. TaxID=267 RepID=UPI003A8C1FB2